MAETPKPRNLKGTWKQALVTFLSPFVLLFVFRWAILEFFVIPSSSMVPTLLIHDHILVKKWSYGLKQPFGDDWLFFWQKPQRGDVVVFRYPKNPNVFYIKRLIGLPGDKIVFENKILTVNGLKWETLPLENSSREEEDSEGFTYFEENSGDKESHIIRYLQSHEEHERLEIDVPEKNYFFMGDNRDQSSDSRIWGFVPQALLIGPAWSVWLSCSQTLENMPMVCDPQKLRWSRFFKKIVVRGP